MVSNSAGQSCRRDAAFCDVLLEMRKQMSFKSLAPTTHVDAQKTNTSMKSCLMMSNWDTTTYVRRLHDVGENCLHADGSSAHPPRLCEQRVW
jgi:hypothetical protein